LCLKNHERFADAAKDFSVAILGECQADLAHLHRGYCNRKLDRFADCVGDYSKALLLLSDDISNPAVATTRVRALTNRAYALARLGKYLEAVADYTDIIAIEPLNGHAFHNRGISYDKMGMQVRLRLPALLLFHKIFQPLA
jgi:tetratricopeptide (TPR) repeat protein